MDNLDGNFSALLANSDHADGPALGPFFRLLHDVPATRPIVDFFNDTLGFGTDVPGLPEIFLRGC